MSQNNMSKNKYLEVQIITPQKVAYKGNAESVAVPGGLSSFQALTDHAPIVSTLEKGFIHIKDLEGRQNKFSTTEGFVEIRKNQVSILVEEAIVAD